MTMSAEFRDYILDLLAPIGPLSARRMFGGGGLFMDGRMFALIADDVLYFKVDAGNAPEYDRYRAPAFTYQRGGKLHSLSYREVPVDILDNDEYLCVWATHAQQVARRAAARTNSKRVKSSPTKQTSA